MATATTLPVRVQNPLTGRWISRDGVLHRRLQRQGHMPTEAPSCAYQTHPGAQPTNARSFLRVQLRNRRLLLLPSSIQPTQRASLSSFMYKACPSKIMWGPPRVAFYPSTMPTRSSTRCGTRTVTGWISRTPSACFFCPNPTVARPQSYKT